MTTAKRCIELCAPLQRLVELGMLWRSLLKVDARIAAQSAYSQPRSRPPPRFTRTHAQCPAPAAAEPLALDVGLKVDLILGARVLTVPELHYVLTRALLAC